MVSILIVEDEADIRMDIMDMLELEGFQTLGAENGLEGLELAKSRLPDLIISDIMMPKMDGYQLLLNLQTNATTATIPVLFLTAKADKQDIRKGMGFGADDYITKPFSHKDLLEAINVRLAKQARITQNYRQHIDELHSSLTRSLPHELRTPLNSILGYTSFLLEDIYSFDHEQMHSMIETVFRAGQRLERLAENYLTYTQIELAHFKPETIEKTRKMSADNPIYAAPIVEYLALKYAESYDREADLVLEISGNELAIAFYDDDFKKVIAELLDNAFKFSERGTTVHVTFGLIDAEATLKISDEGRGMSSEQIKKIDAFLQFEREFYEQQGLGLGLVIVKGLLDIYAGTIMIESVPNQGTSVLVSLPTL